MADRVARVATRTFRQDSGALYRRPNSLDVALENVIFDDTFFATDTNTGIEVSSKNPVMGVRTADLPSPRSTKTDLIILDRQGLRYTFRITDVQPDGEAMTTLFLTNAQGSPVPL